MRRNILNFFSLALIAGFASCKMAHQVQEPEKISSPKDLKSWTEQVLRWDESTVAAAITHLDLDEKLYKNKININDFDQVLKDFVTRTVASPIAAQEKWLGEKRPPKDFYVIGDFAKEFQNKSESENLYFIQKISIPVESKIIVVGDLHGSIHSLLRNLWRLVARGFLDHDFKIIKENTYLIFTGDFVDRGRYSAECLYTLLRLKLANFDNVFLIRGNHETEDLSLRYGLSQELSVKYKNAAQRLFIDINNFYRFLPVAIFAETKTDKASVLHFSHGGFSYDARKKELLHNPAYLIKDKEAIYELISPKIAQGYMWSDFHQADKSLINISRGYEKSHEGVSLLGQAAFFQYKQAIQKNADIGLAGIFRGHQDRGFGVKMLFKKEPPAVELNKLKTTNIDYPDGPFYWQDVVSNPAIIAEARTKGILLDEYREVFTFTTASEGQGVPFDAYGLIKIKNNISDYLLEIHEHALIKRVAKRSYLSINVGFGDQEDSIALEWSENLPGKLSFLKSPK